MRRSLRQIWNHLPFDGWGWGRSGDGHIDRIRRHGASGFWSRRPVWARPFGPLLSRALWTLAAAQSVRRLARTEDLGPRAALALYGDCLMSGARAEEALIHRAHYRRRHPFPAIAVLLSLPRLGDPAEHQFLGDKQATSNRLAAAGLDVPVLYAEIEQGGAPDLTAPPWTAPAALLVKPRHGSNGRGIRTVDVLWPGCVRVAGGRLVSTQQFADHLTRLARFDSCLVQERLTPAPELAGLAAGIKPPVVRLAVAHAPGEPPFVHSALLALDMPGIDPNDLLRGKLRAPVDLATGRLGPALLFANPRETFAAAPWNGAPIAGLELPRFTETIAAVLKASALFPGLALINWELVPAPRGPVFLEGNTAGNWNTTEFPRIAAPDYPSVSATLARWL